jgi:hypothetical protein
LSIDIFSVLNGSSDSIFPARDPGAVSGSAWIQNNMNLEGSVREANILNELMHGNMPDFLKNLVPVTVTNGANSITYLAMPDVLAIGSDQDYVRMPMTPLTAQAVADHLDCSLPTKKMVDDIWHNATNKLIPLPWGPPYDASMQSTYRIGVQNSKIQAQLTGLNPHALTSGHKKDLVLTNHLYPNNPNKRVAIYGWIQTNGIAIQGLNPVSHEVTYEDYSHGPRLIANDVLVNHQQMTLQQVFADPILSRLVSDEGAILFQRY